MDNLTLLVESYKASMQAARAEMDVVNAEIVAMVMHDQTSSMQYTHETYLERTRKMESLAKEIRNDATKLSNLLHGDIVNRIANA